MRYLRLKLSVLEYVSYSAPRRSQMKMAPLESLIQADHFSFYTPWTERHGRGRNLRSKNLQPRRTARLLKKTRAR